MSSSTSVVAAAGDTGSTTQGGSHRPLVKLGTCRQFFSGNTCNGATAVNITTTSNASFVEK
jgi:hypothetical protein